MRILAIRGENLASLEGAFEVDLEGGPLAHAGLFAITGPTGAGKTTLLDALCLALFGKTPRIEATPGRGHAVGRNEESERISTRDPRMLLRRGAGQGHAEVVFLGSDGARYVARWSVRRARNRPDGRLQNVEMELRDEEGIAIGRTLTEVQREIQERLGLDYDQFCRSVLLAQGEFAAFLRADEKKRAELLEAVTGTGIYRDLSIAAHERCSEARRELELLHRDHDAQPVLSPDELEALQEEHLQTAKAFADAKTNLQQVVAVRDWYKELSSRREAEARAAAEHAAAEAAWEAAETTRAQLAAVEEVLPLEPLLRSVDEAEARRVAVANRWKEAAASAEAATKKATDAKSRLEQATLAQKALADEQQELAPVLREAARLDAEITSAVQRHQEVVTRTREQTDRAERLGADLEKARLELQRLVDEEQEVERWLADHAAWQEVERQWERWKDALYRAAEIEEQSRRSAVQLAERRSSLASLQEALTGAMTLTEEGEAALDGARAELASAEALRPPYGPADLQKARAAVETIGSAVQQLETQVREAVALRDAEARAAADLDKWEGAATEVERELEAARERHARLLRDLEHAAEAERDARSVLDLEARRAELVEGKPCPLCGSDHHPWAGEELPAAGMVKKWRDSLDALQGELRGLERRMGELEAARAESARQSGRLQEELQAHGKQGATLLEAWREGSAACTRLVGDRAGDLERLGITWEMPQLPERPTSGDDAVAAWRATVEGWRKQLATLEAASTSAEVACAAAARALDAARERLERARSAQRDAERKQQELEADCRTIQAHLDGLEAERTRLRVNLTQAFSAVEEAAVRIETDAAGFAEAATETVAAMRERLARRDRISHQHAQVAAAIVPLQQSVDQARDDVQSIRKELDSAAQLVAELKVKRGQLLDGKSVDSVEERLRIVAREAAEAVDVARHHSAEAASAEAASRAEVRALAEQVEEANAEAARRAQELADAAAASGIEIEEARRRLAIDPATLKGWREELGRLQQVRTQTAAVLAERHREREEKESSERPKLAEEKVAEAMAAAEEAHTAAEEAHYQVRIRLEEDRKARERSAAFLPKIEAAERSLALWEKMHELIGAANGDKFQLFAQSLTLDGLLHEANAHLAELAPRYRLERAPGASLELQVIDRDMADEVRSTNSLSGGESFLVSLALALGLSALSSRSTRVESLFIDEGFGTLDPQTLDAALATLDELQATGRKVGLISHVQGMAERIGVQVQVLPQGRGCSRVTVRAA